MSADLFGAPLGIIAREEGNRAAMLGGLQAQKMLGEIAMQPAELQYKKSLGQLHEAEADERQANAAAQRQMLDLQREWSQKELDARSKLVEGAAAQGRTATVEDLKGGSAQEALRPTSQADSLRKFADYAEQRGVPSMALMKLRKEIADISQSEAVGAYRSAQAADIKDRRASTQRQQLGGLAQTAASDPKSYAAIMLNPATRKLLPRELTGSYAADAPVLRAIAQASMTADQQADNARAEREAASRAARRGAGMAQAGAAIALTKVKLETAKEVLTNLKKYGGDTAEATLDAKRSMSEARRAAVVAKEAKAFPPAPLDPKDVEVSKSYTAPNGQRYTVVGRAADGMPLIRPFEAGRAAATKAARAVTNMAMETESDDEED
jgi:hypothetical protein